MRIVGNICPDRVLCPAAHVHQLPPTYLPALCSCALVLQIMRIVGNIRPDRQTVMFSATFPRSVETLARQVLQDPVEIQVRACAVVTL
jgi:hypothetical protein